MMRVCIGGTFDILHEGHKLLIKKAFETAGVDGLVFFGISTGALLKEKNHVKSYKERKKMIEQHIINENYASKVIIQPIHDKYGPSIDGNFDAIIVSPETFNTALEINNKRKKIGKKSLKIIKILYVLAEDEKPISSTRIKNKEIDEEGKLLLRD